LRGHGVSPKNSIKGRGKIRLFRRIFTPLLTKNYSFYIKMSTRIKSLSFEMLYCKAKSKNAEFRKKSIDWLLILSQGGTYFSVWVVDTLYAMLYALCVFTSGGRG
jgi:hypothetical protein